jgi:hypothetical protein
MKDAEVIKKSVQNKELTLEELDYLSKIRPYYTPAAYKQIKEVMQESTTKPTADIPFEDLVIMIHRKSQSGEKVYIDPRPVINAAARMLTGGSSNENE